MGEPMTANLQGTVVDDGYEEAACGGMVEARQKPRPGMALTEEGMIVSLHRYAFLNNAEAREAVRQILTEGM